MKFRLRLIHLTLTECRQLIEFLHLTVAKTKVPILLPKPWSVLYFCGAEIFSNFLTDIFIKMEFARLHSSGLLLFSCQIYFGTNFFFRQTEWLACKKHLLYN